MVPISIFIFSCSHTRQYLNDDEINLISEGKVVDIKMVWGNTLHGKSIQVESDSAYWIGRKIDQSYSAPLKSIHKISIIDRKRGAWYGFRSFLYTGIAVGTFAVLDDQFSITPESDGQGLNIDLAPATILGGFTLLGGFYGLTVGAPVGAYFGYRNVYVITDVTQSTNMIINKP